MSQQQCDHTNLIDYIPTLKINITSFKEKTHIGVGPEFCQQIFPIQCNIKLGLFWVVLPTCEPIVF